MKTRQILIACACTLFAFTMQAQTQVIAHRGFWKAEGSAQNSITALNKAAAIKVYGSEFDVQLTADGTIIVNHDDAINGITIGDTRYDKLKDLRLKNGEKLPTLADYLDAGKKHPELRLILEIKPHKTKEQEDLIAKETVKLVKSYGMEKQVEYISFSLNICEQLSLLTPESDIAYLNGDIRPENLKKKGINGIDYDYLIFKQHPEWVEEAHKLGMKVNTWTVNHSQDIQQMLELKTDYITTDYPIKVQHLITKQMNLTLNSN